MKQENKECPKQKGVKMSKENLKKRYYCGHCHRFHYKHYSEYEKHKIYRIK